MLSSQIRQLLPLLQAQITPALSWATKTLLAGAPTATANLVLEIRPIRCFQCLWILVRRLPNELLVEYVDLFLNFAKRGLNFIPPLWLHMYIDFQFRWTCQGNCSRGSTLLCPIE